MDIPAKDLKEAIIEHGPLVFKQELLTPLNRLILRASYKTEPLRTAIEDILGKEAALTPLNKLDPPLLIPAVNYTMGRTEILASRGVAGHAAAQIPIIEAILATRPHQPFSP